MVVFTILMIFVPWLSLLRHWNNPKEWAEAAENRRRDSFILILLMHPSLSGLSFQFFRCQVFRSPLGIETKLVVDYSLSCHDSEWYGMLAFALSVVGLFSIGTPLLLAWLLWRRREYIQATTCIKCNVEPDLGIMTEDEKDRHRRKRICAPCQRAFKAEKAERANDHGDTVVVCDVNVDDIVLEGLDDEAVGSADTNMPTQEDGYEESGETKGETKGEAKGKAKGEPVGETKGEEKGRAKGGGKGEENREGKGEEMMGETKGTEMKEMETKGLDTDGTTLVFTNLSFAHSGKINRRDRLNKLSLSRGDVPRTVRKHSDSKLRSFEADELKSAKDWINGDNTSKLFGVLYMTYRPGAYYFEPVQMLFKVALYASLALFENGSQFQLACGLSICFIQVAVQARIMPFDSEYKNQLQFIGLGLSANLAFAGLILNYLNANKDIERLRGRDDRAKDIDDQIDLFKEFTATIAFGGIALIVVLMGRKGWKSREKSARLLKKLQKKALIARTAAGNFARERVSIGRRKTRTPSREMSANNAEREGDIDQQVQGRERGWSANPFMEAGIEMAEIVEPNTVPVPVNALTVRAANEKRLAAMKSFRSSRGRANKHKLGDAGKKSMGASSRRTGNVSRRIFQGASTRRIGQPKPSPLATPFKANSRSGGGAVVESANGGAHGGDKRQLPSRAVRRASITIDDLLTKKPSTEVSKKDHIAVAGVTDDDDDDDVKEELEDGWFFVDDNGDVQGPHPTDHMIHWIEEGQLEGETLVVRDGDTKWTAASACLAMLKAVAVGAGARKVEEDIEKAEGTGFSSRVIVEV